jgi:hypothetical protein
MNDERKTILLITHGSSLEIVHSQPARRETHLLGLLAADHVAQGFGGSTAKAAVTGAAEKA